MTTYKRKPNECANCGGKIRIYGKTYLDGVFCTQRCATRFAVFVVKRWEAKSNGKEIIV